MKGNRWSVSVAESEENRSSDVAEGKDNEGRTNRFHELIETILNEIEKLIKEHFVG